MFVVNCVLVLEECCGFDGNRGDSLMFYFIKFIVGFIGIVCLVIFVGEFFRSILFGFVGFWGGFFFMVIVIVVCVLVIYDYWDECVCKKD